VHDAARRDHHVRPCPRVGLGATAPGAISPAFATRTKVAFVADFDNFPRRRRQRKIDVFVHDRTVVPRAASRSAT
jgi:hypothetical protein